MKGEIDTKRIEAALSQHPDVKDVVVVERHTNHNNGNAERTAYVVPRRAAHSRDLKFSLFYFADAAPGADDCKYKLYLEGAKFADEHGFEAIWTPERHFHENGGLYPNPSVLSAALATITKQIKLRAGSVALPLHYPLRVAEEWSVVDNLSGGRVGVSFTSGWVPNDFAIAPKPESYQNKREGMLQSLQEVQQLWRGGTTRVRDGAGNEVDLRIFPRPVQRELPIWITCSGDPAMFAKTGELNLHVLTALLTQSLEETAEKIGLYRRALAANGHDPKAGCVTLMLHTFVTNDAHEARRKVQGPLTEYLKSHLGLVKTMLKSLDIKLDGIDPDDPVSLDYFAAFAFERYYQFGSLIGSPATCMAMVDRLKEMGVDEVACFIDFGVDNDSVIESLEYLNELKQLSERSFTINEKALRQFLDERLPGETGALTFEIHNELPAAATRTVPVSDLTRQTKPRTMSAGASAAVLRSVEERVKLRAGRQRQPNKH
ncbi:MAG TPA: MupA/Atu3671 family FMN-dependent luciferase-like monooxygenase [Pyrinomonadaceae bacterium]|nr:MupA/Atu3671 family FMN-dependent luciferase-like monooxygenase [Pyrinomonadaceae bacterium]